MPVVHGLEAQYGDRITFTYLDIDDPATADLKDALRFRYQPQLVLLSGDGTILQTWIGAPDPQELEASLQTSLTP
jgi:hypothetical protein